MNSPVRFDLWQKRRPSKETKRNRKSITLAPFSSPCGETEVCLKVTGAGTTTAIGVTLSSGSAFTLEFWFKPIGNNSAFGITEKTNGTEPNYDVRYTASTGTLVVHVYNTNGDTYTMTVTNLFLLGRWTHFALTYDKANSIAKVYIDGVVVSSVAIDPAYDMWTTSSNVLIYGPNSGGYYLSDYRIWGVVRSAEKINQAMWSRRDLSGTIDAGLDFYWKLKDITASKGAINLALSIANFAFSTEAFPPLIYGASFVAAQWSVTLDQKTSIKFPVARPDGCTFMLVARYTDEQGVIQRKKFWDLAGVDIAPPPVMYAGEKLPLNFVLEAWNVDGAPTVDLPVALILYTGETTIPVSDGDHDSQIAFIPTLDITLAANFDLTPFPLVFNTQQTY